MPRSTLTLAMMLSLIGLLACGDKDGETATLPGGDDTGTDGPPCDLSVDFDCDGYVEDDCDPNSNRTYPGATEIPYDGVDNDCAGDGDLTDLDGDGYDATQAGGDDCNDSNPEINPGAEETCYDNVDYDCDGFPTDDEPEGDDCDGDGYDRGDDCNDEDPAVFPGADEIWYDGVDQNCSGTIENDYDQDGDGEEAAEHSDDGTDCDDTDPTVGFDQPETLDGVDNDCDDVVDTVPLLDSPMSFYGAIATGEGYFGASVVVLDDYDGDGTREVGFGAPLADDDTDACNKVATSPDYNTGPCGGWFTVMPVDGTDGPPSSNFYSRVVGQTGTVGGQGDWLGFAAANVGDLNGDAFSEVAVGAVARSNGVILIMDGSDLATAGDVAASSAYATIRDTGIGGMVAALSDVTGDGKSEIVGGATGGTMAFYALGTSTLELGVWSGADATAGATLLGSGALATIDDDGAGGGVVGEADFNGDGLPDLALGTDVDGTSGTVVLWDGSDIAAGGVFTAADYAQITGPVSSYEGAGMGITVGWLDDIDSDGYPELAAAAPLATGDEEGSGVTYILDGDVLSTSGTAASLAMASVNGTEYFGLSQIVSASAGDINADGTSDLVVGDIGGTSFNSISGTVWIYSGTDLAGGGTLTSEDAMGAIPSRSRDDIWGAVGTMADLDDDGDSDIAISGALANDVGMGALFLSGFAD